MNYIYLFVYIFIAAVSGGIVNFVVWILLDRDVLFSKYICTCIYLIYCNIYYYLAWYLYICYCGGSYGEFKQKLKNTAKNQQYDANNNNNGSNNSSSFILPSQYSQHDLIHLESTESSKSNNSNNNSNRNRSNDSNNNISTVQPPNKRSRVDKEEALVIDLLDDEDEDDEKTKEENESEFRSIPGTIPLKDIMLPTVVNVANNNITNYANKESNTVYTNITNTTTNTISTFHINSNISNGNSYNT